MMGDARVSDLVQQFKAWRPAMSAKDRADALKVINEQIEMTMANAQDMAKNLVSLTPKYREAWASQIEKRRIDLAELEEVKKLLTD